MKHFYASRLTRGNEIVPTRLSIDGNGVYIRSAGLFNGEETFIPFSHISSIRTDCPFIGYSTIHIFTTGQEPYSVHGFNSYEIRQMKDLILPNIGR
ncbi:MAG: PH domain-containing protein [Cryomorphaceae bacterium]|nr:PH domain-containing protein [Cryomorphaceae bacterium]